MLALIAAVFLGPLLLAFALYFGGAWRPSGSTEHGELLEPTALSGAPLAAGENAPRFRAKWSIVHVADGRCDDARCARHWAGSATGSSASTS